MAMAAASAAVAKFPQLVILLAFLCLHEGTSFSHSTCSQRIHHQQQQRHHNKRHTTTTSRVLFRYSRPGRTTNDIYDNNSNYDNNEDKYHDQNNDDDTDIRGHPKCSSHKIIASPKQQQQHQYRRRNVLSSVAATTLASASAAAISFPFTLPNTANAAVGTLPEFSNTNAILQSITIDVIDKSQFDETIAFFTGGAFEGMKLLRERNTIVPVATDGDDDSNDSLVQEAWLGFGPEILSIPSTFTLPVSSFSQYGGHASIHVRYDPQLGASLPSSSNEEDEKKTSPQYYQRSSGEYNNAPPTGDNIAYLQLGVPAYRISQMVKNYGNILDAYGWVNVISPCGLPVRAIVGIRPDPIMFLAVNCLDVKKSEEFYYETLGFVRQEYPYARLNQGQGQFEPPQPPKSVYIGPSPNCMGILLLQNKNRKKSIVPNPTFHSLNVVYAPVDGGSSRNSSGSDDSAGLTTPTLLDPSFVPISFKSQEYLDKEIKVTSIAASS